LLEWNRCFEPDKCNDRKNLFNNILPIGNNGYVLVVKDNCGDAFTFELEGPDPIFKGFGDLHDPSFDAYASSSPMEKYKSDPKGLCQHTLHVYPSSTLRASYNTIKPAVYTAVVVCSFLLTGIMFVVYDWLVNKRQQKTMEKALRTNAIVSSLFPENVRDRLLEDARKASSDAKKGTGAIKSFLSSQGNDVIDGDDDDFFATKPIADLFPNATVMVCDVNSALNPALRVNFSQS
jgi:hypothetical protein